MIFVSLILVLQTPLSAADALPYSTRTLPYSGWSTTARGDLRTVGMSGATQGVADTFNAALDNPAGLAMALNPADLNFASNSISDGLVQNMSNPLDTYNVGLAVNHHPWGFSLGYVAPATEGQSYQLSSVPNDTANLLVATQALYLSGARVFFNNRLSLGLSLIFGQAENQISFTQSTFPALSETATAVAGSIGASIQLPYRFLIGLSYHLPVRYSVPATASPGLPGFFQPIVSPSRLGIGLGWIPNRFFRADFTTLIIGRNDASALLRDETLIAGEAITLQPKLGVAYHFMDFKELQATAYLGSYLEVSRTRGIPNRLHGTGGIEIKPWIFLLGGGVDLSYQYQNFIIGAGIDVIKTLSKADLIPQLPRPRPAGFRTSPTSFSDDGLPRALVKQWKPGPELNPIDVGLSLPGRIEKKAEQLGQNIADAFQSKPKKAKGPKKPKTPISSTSPSK